MVNWGKKNLNTAYFSTHAEYENPLLLSSLCLLLLYSSLLLDCQILNGIPHVFTDLGVSMSPSLQCIEDAHQC